MLSKSLLPTALGVTALIICTLFVSGCVEVSVTTEFAADGSGSRDIFMRQPLEVGAATGIFAALKNNPAPLFNMLVEVYGHDLEKWDTWPGNDGEYVYYNEVYTFDSLTIRLPFDPSALGTALAAAGAEPPMGEMGIYCFAGPVEVGGEKVFFYVESWDNAMLIDPGAVIPQPETIPIPELEKITGANTVVMPGEIIDTNGERKGRNEVSWDFDSEMESLLMVAISETD